MSAYRNSEPDIGKIIYTLLLLILILLYCIITRIHKLYVYKHNYGFKSAEICLPYLQFIQLQGHLSCSYTVSTSC